MCFVCTHVCVSVCVHVSVNMYVPVCVHDECLVGDGVGVRVSRNVKY